MQTMQAHLDVHIPINYGMDNVFASLLLDSAQQLEAAIVLSQFFYVMQAAFIP